MNRMGKSIVSAVVTTVIKRAIEKLTYTVGQGIALVMTRPAVPGGDANDSDIDGNTGDRIRASRNTRGFLLLVKGIFS